MIHVSVRSVSGELLELDMDPHMVCSALKSEISRAWWVPPLCQKLFVDNAMVPDAALVSSYGRGRGPLSLTMLVSLDDAQNELDSGVLVRQVNALKALIWLGMRDGGSVVRGVSEHLESGDCLLRRAAVVALAQVAQRQDARAADALIARLKDQDFRVREAAIQALAQVAASGDERAVAAASAQLETSDVLDMQDRVRCAAVEALGQLARRGHQRTLVGVIAQLDREWYVRCRALRTLGQVAQKGDRRVIATLIGRLEDEHPAARLAAVDALAQVAWRGDARSFDDVRVRVLRVRREDENLDVQAAADAALKALRAGSRGAFSAWRW